MIQRNVVSAADIIDQIQHNKCQFKNLDIDGEIDISGPIVMSLKFNNCNFNDRFRIRFARFSEGITLDQCKFEKSIIFENVEANADSTKADIRLIQCKTIGIYFIHVNTGTVDIEDCESVLAIINDTNFKSFKYSGGSLEFIDIKRIRGDHLTIMLVTITNDISVHESTIETLKVLQVKGEPRVIFKDIASNDTSVYECVFSYLRLFDATGQIELTRNEFRQASRIENKKESRAKWKHISLKFRGNTFGKTFNVDGEKIDSLNTVVIDCNDGLSGQLHFNGCNFNFLEITGTNTAGELLFINAQIRTFRFTDFTNLNSILLSSCTPWRGDAQLSIVRSDMGSAKFLTHNFDEYHSVLIEKSFLSEILVISCRWFADNQFSTGESENENAKREVYRQLKHACEKQGDRIQALQFRAEELKAFEKETKLTKPWWSGDRWLLRLSRTNGFGLHWDMALGWLVIWTIPFFVGMAIFASPNLTWSPAKSEEEFVGSLKIIWWDHLQILVQLFNPAHNPLAFVDKNISPLYFVLDGIHRIGAVFLIVQIITAFRKYIRS